MTHLSNRKLEFYTALLILTKCPIKQEHWDEMTNIKWYSVYSTHQPEQCQSPKLQHRAECRRDRSGSAVSLCSTKSLDKKHNRKMLKKRCRFLSCTSTFEATDAHLQLALLLEPSITDILARWLGSKGSCYQKCWILLVKTCTSPPPKCKTRPMLPPVSWPSRARRCMI